MIWKYLKKKYGPCWFHDWIYAGSVTVIDPKRGPYDPRSDVDRTYRDMSYVCAKCGKKKPEKDECPSWM